MLPATWILIRSPAFQQERGRELQSQRDGPIPAQGKAPVSNANQRVALGMLKHDKQFALEFSITLELT